MQINRNWTPFFIAIGVGLIAMAYYIVSGRGSYDLNVRDLAANDKIEKIESGDMNRIQVKCKNGENYEISFSDGLGSYDDMIFNACGTEGTQE